MNNDLVKWLRTIRSPFAGQAADLIEQQQAEIDRLNADPSNIVANAIESTHNREVREKIEALTKERDQLKAAICIYAREELGNMNFEDDAEVINYFLSFSAWRG